VNFAAIALCIASQRVFIVVVVVVVVYFVIDSVRKLLDTPSYILFFRRSLFSIRHSRSSTKCLKQ
jgi:disulfide bond formation protein DsbB